MFRTRDFILLFSAIMFLVMAIGTTLINQGRSNVDGQTVVLDPESDHEYVATLADSNEMTRAERVAKMRSKISQKSFVSEAPLEEEVVEVVEATTTDEVSDDEVGKTVQCPDYRPYLKFWDARDLNLIESEGAIVLARGVMSSTSLPEAVLQLPMRALPSNNPSCLESDVVGIANDGSLIRNDEVALYSIFGSETLLGYALDGFPIYGAGTSLTDACGGVSVGGRYRYQIESGRETIINCFASLPVSLP